MSRIRSLILNGPIVSASVLILGLGLPAILHLSLDLRSVLPYANFDAFNNYLLGNLTSILLMSSTACFLFSIFYFKSSKDYSPILISFLFVLCAFGECAYIMNELKSAEFNLYRVQWGMLKFAESVMFCALFVFLTSGTKFKTRSLRNIDIILAVGGISLLIYLSFFHLIFYQIDLVLLKIKLLPFKYKLASFFAVNFLLYIISSIFVKNSSKRNTCNMLVLVSLCSQVMMLIFSKYLFDVFAKTSILIGCIPATVYMFTLMLSFNKLTAEKNSLIGKLEEEVVKNDESTKILQKEKEDAVVANKTKISFLANMSHELRTPLNAIIGYSELIYEDCKDMTKEEIRSDVEKVIISAKHLLSLINDVLDLSKIEVGKVKLKPEIIPLEKYIQDVKDTVASLMSKNKNDFEVKISTDLRKIFNDPIKLRQCLLNLLANAAKFTSNGKVLFEVTAEKIEEKNQSIIFTIQDSGIGIPKNKINKIFESFTQIDNTITRQYDGTGLGLSITKQIIEAMGGEIKVESKENVGTTFIAKLPISLNSPETNDEISDDQDELNTGIMNVILLESQDSVYDAVKEVVKRPDFELSKYDNPIEALQVSEMNPPQFFIIGSRLQYVDGWKAVRLIRDNKQICHIPILKISSGDNLQLINQYKIDALIKRPFSSSDLRVAIKRITNKEFLDTEAVCFSKNEEWLETVSANLETIEMRVHSSTDMNSVVSEIKNKEVAFAIFDFAILKKNPHALISKIRAESKNNKIVIAVIVNKDFSLLDLSKISRVCDLTLCEGEFKLKEDLIDFAERKLREIYSRDEDRKIA